MAELLERITLDPEIRSGKPVIRGTRIMVTDILDYLAGGMSHEEILADFPPQEEADIRAALTLGALTLSRPDQRAPNPVPERMIVAAVRSAHSSHTSRERERCGRTTEHKKLAARPTPCGAAG
jgi:uncharacterized protein (DUF433 family)